MNPRDSYGFSGLYHHNMTFHSEGQRGVPRPEDNKCDSALEGGCANQDTTGLVFPKKRLSGSTSSSSSTVAPSSPKLLHTDIPADLPAAHGTEGLNQGLLCTPKPDGVVGVFVNDCPPSPQLTKNLLAHAQSRKRAGRHHLVAVSAGSNSRVLRLTGDLVDAKTNHVEAPIDRQAIPNDLYESLLSIANHAKKTGQHKMLRRRHGLGGELESVLLLNQETSKVSNISSLKKSYSSLFSPDPSLF